LVRRREEGRGEEGRGGRRKREGACKKKDRPFSEVNGSLGW
jgi:hypothetical protein